MEDYLYFKQLGSITLALLFTSAYKHVHVCEDDLKLQVVRWGDRYFVDMKLIFGSRSSPGIFDELAKVFLWSCMSLSGMPSSLVEQHIDDVLGVGLPGPNSLIWGFHDTYKREAKKIGIRLDDSGNKEKAQEPGTVVTGLGVVFDTVSWTWGFHVDKIARILRVLQEVAEAVRVPHRDMESITGKLCDVRFLVPGGRYNMLYFMLAVHDSDARMSGQVTVGRLLRVQAGWWVTALKAANVSSPIVHPDYRRPSNALEAWSDAAGGSCARVGSGLGVVGPQGAWVYLPWPAWLNMGAKNSQGVRFASKLSCLELLGPLAALCMMGSRLLGKVLVVYVDNQGSVDIFRKGTSLRCVYTSTVSKACFDLSLMMGCTLLVEKVRRCSDAGSYLADMISKGDLVQFRQLMPGRRLVSELPGELVRWIKDPVEDLDLGWRIAAEMKGMIPTIVLIK